MLNPSQANEELLKIIMIHLVELQSGSFGSPTLKDLEFCGKLHSLVNCYRQFALEGFNK